MNKTAIKTINLQWQDAKARIDNQRWELSIDQISDCVKVSAHRGGIIYTGGYGSWYVYPPNILERLFKITYDQKIEKAIKACEEFCRKENAREATARAHSKMGCER